MMAGRWHICASARGVAGRWRRLAGSRQRRGDRAGAYAGRRTERRRPEP